MMRDVAAFVLIVLFVIGLQFEAGAYDSELGNHGDEPSHLVSGLMVREYLLAPGAMSPIKFAENYYLHYPKVAIGNWPPMFYLGEAVWALVIPPSRASIMILMALITALLAFTLYRMAQPEFGWVAAVGLGLLLVAFPPVQHQSSHVLTDNACALLSLGAALVFCRYLGSPTVANGILWGAGACLAILTKGNGLALAYLPPLAILLTRRFDLLRRWSLWLSAALVAVVCGPWYWWTFPMAHSAWQEDWGFLSPAVHRFGATLGAGLLPFLLVGLGTRVFRPLRREGAPRFWAVMAALLIGWILFHSFFVPGGGERKVIGALAPGLMFVAAGIRYVGRVAPLGQFGETARVALVAAAAAGIFFVMDFEVPTSPGRGHSELAEMIVSDASLDGAAVLVSSTGLGEGALIAEVALRQPSPRHYILRASKMLSDSDWYGMDYRPRFDSVASLREALAAIPVSLLVLDTEEWREMPPHHQQLMELTAAYPREWRRVKACTRPGGSLIAVYRCATGPRRVQGEISVDVSRTLGREIAR